MTPDRSFAPEVMAMNLVPYMRSLQKLDTVFTVTYRLMRVARAGNALEATIGSDYGGVEKTKLYDQIVVNHGTVPLDELFFALKPLSSNGGEISHAALIEGAPQRVQLARRFADECLRLSLYGSMRPEAFPDVAERVAKGPRPMSRRGRADS